MSNYTVIKADTAIYKDGKAIIGCDMAGLPDYFHAFQWDGSDGHIEYSGGGKPNLEISSESDIESALGISLLALIERRDTRLVAIEAEEAEVIRKAVAEEKARDLESGE